MTRLLPFLRRRPPAGVRSRQALAGGDPPDPHPAVIRRRARPGGFRGPRHHCVERLCVSVLRLLPLRGDPLVPILAATLGFRCASAYTEAVNAPVFDPHRPDDPPAPSTPCTAFSPGFHIPHFAGLLIAVLGLAACAMGASALAAGFHVATHGNDAWSGTLPAPNAAGADGPFATVDRARMAIRQLKAAGALPAGGVQVTVHGGLYRFARPLELTAEDSGNRERSDCLQRGPERAGSLAGWDHSDRFQGGHGLGRALPLEESARGNVLEGGFLSGPGSDELRGCRRRGPRVSLLSPMPRPDGRTRGSSRSPRYGGRHRWMCGARRGVSRGS